MSFKNYSIWEIKERKEKDLLKHLLRLRGISEEEEESFLSPKFPEHLFDPFLMTDMKKAILRLKQAEKDSEKIGIFSDYDADGIMGAVLLSEGLKKAGFAVSVFISERSYGYGLNKKGISELALEGCKLIVTVDLGITGEKLVTFAKSLGMEVIITDHHEVQPALFPKSAVAVLNPKIPPYPFPGLSGAAVAWKLLYAMALSGFKISENFLKWSLDLVALSTIADIVPLISESRVLYRFGEIVLKKTRRPGLLALYKKAGVDKTQIVPWIVSHILGPRVNAANRIASSRLAYKLFTSEDLQTVEELAEKLEELNWKRQQLVNKALLEAKTSLDLSKKMLVVFGNWSEGINGLIAQKLSEEYLKPALSFSPTSDGRWRGSARGVSEINLLSLFSPLKKHLCTFGGHKSAVGLTLFREKQQVFLESLLQEAEKLKLEAKLTIDALLKKEEINRETLEILKRLEPFGSGNPKPLFAADLKVSRVRRVGEEGEHLQLDFEGLGGIAFSAREALNWVLPSQIYRFAFELTEDNFFEKKEPRLKILDVKKV